MPELRCCECNRYVNSDKYSDKILIGDTFYIYTCSSCGGSSGETFERLPISWSNLIQLVLYHLWMGGDKKHRYFRWKEDICGTIEEKWNDLIPNKSKSASWSNSVSSALSSNDRIFASGMAIKGAPGWWALHHWEPPTPPRKLTIKQKSKTMTVLDDTMTEDIIISSGEDDHLMMTFDEKNEDLIVDEPELEEFEDVKPDFTASAEVVDVQDADIMTTNSTGPLVPSADLKQQLLERLLMMDSSLLQDAIKKAKAKKLAEIEITAKKKKKEEAAAAAAAIKDEMNSKSSEPPLSLPVECIETLEPIMSVLSKRLQMYPVIRASPYENDLLKRCHRVNYQEHKNVARLRRKLLLRRQRRRVNLALFDLDQWMYFFLKSPESALLLLEGTQTSSQNPKKDSIMDSSSSKPAPLQFPITFDPQSIPYIADPSRSLYAKLTGMAAIYGTCPYPIISPFTGKLLPEFICEDDSSKDFPKLNLLNELRSYMRSNYNNNEEEDNDNNGDYEEEEYIKVEYSSLLKPSALESTSKYPLEPLTIKYTNLRKEFVGQLNNLLSDSFWPGIDVSEALDYPDYAIIALVGLSVVGCAICNPDGYLSYLYVRPDFQGHHLATKLLSILLPLLSPRKDITLHVSVSNTAAMLLYQRIGFKPEEFIVNFYDKYLGYFDKTDEKEEATVLHNNTRNNDNKNAFFMRLRR